MSTVKSMSQLAIRYEPIFERDLGLELEAMACISNRTSEFLVAFEQLS